MIQCKDVSVRYPFFPMLFNKFNKILILLTFQLQIDTKNCKKHVYCYLDNKSKVLQRIACNLVAQTYNYFIITSRNVFSRKRNSFFILYVFQLLLLEFLTQRRKFNLLNYSKQPHNYDLH